MTFRLATHGHAFATRPRGAELLGVLEAAADGVDEVAVDFADVRHISYSFADEFAGALLQRAARGDYEFAVELANVPPKMQRLIDASAKRRGVDRRAVAA